MSAKTSNIVADERRAPGSTGAPSNTKAIGPLEIMTLEELHARRAERLKAAGSPEDVGILQSILAEFPPASCAALRNYYLDDFSAAEAASRNGLAPEEFSELRSSARKHFNVLTGRGVRS